MEEKPKNDTEDEDVDFDLHSNINMNQIRKKLFKKVDKNKKESRRKQLEYQIQRNDFYK